MKSIHARALLAILFTFFLYAAVAQDRPAKQNPGYRPAASTTSFSSFTTAAVLTIKSAAIAKDGTFTAQFTLTDSNGNGLDVYTPGVEQQFV